MPEIVEKIKAVLPLNWVYLGNPVNWIIVFLMVAFAGAAIAVVVKSAAPEME